jgi:hypothetical protein
MKNTSGDWIACGKVVQANVENPSMSGPSWPCILRIFIICSDWHVNGTAALEAALTRSINMVRE